MVLPVFETCSPNMLPFPPSPLQVEQLFWEAGVQGDNHLSLCVPTGFYLGNGICECEKGTGAANQLSISHQQRLSSKQRWNILGWPEIAFLHRRRSFHLVAESCRIAFPQHRAVETWGTAIFTACLVRLSPESGSWEWENETITSLPPSTQHRAFTAER